MKILITGGSGFVGKILLKKLDHSRLDIIYLTRSKVFQDLLRSKGIGFFEADITDVISLIKVKKEIKDINQIIHLAALVPRKSEEDVLETMFKINVNGTMNLLKIFAEKIKSFIYVSTTEVYGLPSKSIPIDEEFPANPLTYYALSKLAAEKISEIFLRKDNAILTILRLSTLYGAGDMISRAIPNFIKSVLTEESPKVYGEEQLRDYLHVDDAAEAIKLATLKPHHGIFNIGSSKGIPIKKIAEEIIKRVNPNLKIKFLSSNDNKADLVLNIDKAKNIFKFQPKFYFPDRLDEEIEWIRRNQ